MALRVIRRLRDLLDVDTSGVSDGDALTYDAGSSTWVPGAGGGGGGGGGAPTTADYLVGTADGTLSNEIVVGTSPGGELGGTWASPTVDATHSGSSHASVQAAAEATAAAALSAAEDGLVTLAPGSSSRNVIQPSAGAVIAAVLKAHASQSVDLLQLQDSSGNPLLALSKDGRLLIGSSVITTPIAAAVDAYVAASLVSGEPDVFGATFAKQSIATRIQNYAANLGSTDTAAYYFGIQGAVRGPADAARYGVGFGVDFSSIFRGTAADSSSVQAQGVYGGRMSALDYSYDTGGDAATGRIQSLVGVEAYSSHAGLSRVNSITGVHAYAQAQQLLTGTPGPIGSKIVALIGELALDNTISGTVPKAYGLEVVSYLGGATVTEVAGVKVPNLGESGTTTSYGILVAAQSGATTSYGIVVQGGLSTMTDGLLVGKTSAFADGDIANGYGGWWWDQTNSVPLWKGKKSAGVVVNFTPQAQDADLDAIAALSPSNDDIIQRKAGAWTNRTIAQLLADLAAVGTTFQPLDSDLTAFAGLSIAADKLPYGTGSHTLGLADLTSFARTLLDDADAATARTTLGITSVSADGWVDAAETWTYSSADGPTGVFTVAADVTTKYSVGMRVKYTQTTVKYGIITAVSTFSGGNTTITIYGGTDYTTANAAISANYYSRDKAPQGFPLSRAKWTETTSYTSTTSQNAPTNSTWYNVGSISLVVPIGSWVAGYEGSIGGDKSGASTTMDVFATLSDANNTELNKIWTSQLQTSDASASGKAIVGNVKRENVLDLAAKSTRYLNLMCDVTGSNITVYGAASTMLVRAVCAYL